MKAINYSTLVTALVFAAASQPAFAQDATKPNADPAAEAKLEDIIVTATRRSENLQNVPIAITAVTETQLAASGVGQVLQLSQLAAGLVVTNSQWAVQPVIRGVGTRGSAPGDESNVAIYVDGVYQPSMNSNNFELLNVERIEVLKGPQGTLFGRNSTGGAINVITRRPSADLAGEATLGYGSYNAFTARGYLTGAVAPRLTADVAAIYGREDGYVRDLVRGGRIGRGERVTGRARLMWKPTDATEFLLAASYSRNSDPSTFLISAFNGNTVGAKVPGNIIATQPRTYAGGVIPSLVNRQFDINLQTKFDLGKASLEVTADHQENKTTLTIDNDGTRAAIQSNQSPDFFLNANSVEIRLLSTTAGRFKWVLGGLGYSSSSGINPYNVFIGADPGPGVNPLVAVNTKQDTNAFAGFGEATWEVVDRLFLTGGVRYSFESKKYYGTGKPTPRDEASWGSFTPRASIRYEFNPNNNVFFTYSRGFKSGIFNGTGAPGTPAVNPEYIDNFELGLKAQPSSWLRTNISLFKYKYKDLQALVSNNAAGSLLSFQNAGSVKAHGVDIDITATPLPGLSLGVSAEYLHARFGTYNNALVVIPVVASGVAGVPNGTLIGGTTVVRDISGNVVPRTPTFTGIFNASYSFDALGGKVTLAGNVNYNDGFYVENGNRLRQPAYTMVNANVGWVDASGRFKIGVWVKNLANADVIVWSATIAQGDFFSYQKPRTYGASIGVKF